MPFGRDAALRRPRPRPAGGTRCTVSRSSPVKAPLNAARTARCATAIEIRFSSSEHDLAYPSLEVIRTGRRKLPPRHLPATPRAHRVVTPYCESRMYLLCTFKIITKSPCFNGSGAARRPYLAQHIKRKAVFRLTQRFTPTRG